MDQTELLKLIRSLTPRELRALTYTHDCRQTTSLHECCNELRCQACHVQHLKQCHEIAALHAYQKFASAGNLTWRAKEYKQPLKSKVNKKPRAISNKPKGVNLADLSDEQLDRLAKLIIERGSK